MGKYEGINIVEATASKSETLQTKIKKPIKFKGFFIELAVCAALALCIFSGKFLPIPKYDEFTDGVKTIVEFDIIEYIKDKVKA